MNTGNNQNNVHVIVLLSVLGLGWLAMVSIAGFSRLVFQDKKAEAMKVNTLGKVPNRYMAVYNGPSIGSPTRAAYSNAPMVSTAPSAPHTGGVAVTMQTKPSSVSRAASSGVGSGAVLPTQSSHTMHAYGGGGGMAGVSGSTGRGATQSAYATSYASVSVPTLAVNRRVSGGASSAVLAVNTAQTAQETAGQQVSGPRRIIDNGDGTYTGSYNGEINGGKYWDEDAEDWVTPVVGTTVVNGGVTYKWDGSAWVITGGDQADPDAPIGELPVVLLLLCAGVAVRRRLTMHNARCRVDDARPKG